MVGDSLERAVGFGEREEQGDAGQRQKELTGKPVHDGRDRHPADVDADNPGERHGQHADIEPADAADDDGEREGTDGEDRQEGLLNEGEATGEPANWTTGERELDDLTHRFTGSPARQF